MSNLIAMTLKWLAHKLGLLLLIVAVLLVGSWLKAEWDRLSAIRHEIETKDLLLANLRADLDSIDSALATDAAAWREEVNALVAARRADLESINARMARAQPKWQEALVRLADIERRAREAGRAADAARAKLEALEQDMYPWDPYLNPGKVVALERARAELALAEHSAKAWQAARQRVVAEQAASPIRSLQEQRSELVSEIAGLADSESPRQQELLAARARKEQEVVAVEQLLEAQRERIAEDPGERLLSAARTRLPLAIAILAGVLLVPVFIKVVFYFLLAPLASRRPPIRILADDRAPVVPEPRPSGVSVPLDIEPGEELLVQSDFLQSSSQPASKQTQWFLNARLPFASLASGMFALTRIRPESGVATRVVVSSQQDAFGEVGVVELPAGAAMVLQPRSLAGVVKPAGAPVQISRHWRLGSLHSWLTLQLRYLVFHGPCRLVLKGCRGVKAEEPAAGQPRMINQSATLGFSANLEYRTTRCETFVAYLRGKEDLFNDLFAGGPGRFIYEEMPAGGRRAGITGRGLEGLADAVLKAFGI